MVVQSRGPLWELEPSGQQNQPQQQQHQQLEREEQEHQEQQTQEIKQQTLTQPEHLLKQLQPQRDSVQLQTQQQLDLVQQRPQQQQDLVQQQSPQQLDPLQQQCQQQPDLVQQQPQQQPDLVQPQSQQELDIVQKKTQPKLLLPQQISTPQEQLQQKTQIERVLLPQQPQTKPELIQQRLQTQDTSATQLQTPPQPHGKSECVQAAPALEPSLNQSPLLEPAHSDQPERVVPQLTQTQTQIKQENIQSQQSQDQTSQQVMPQAGQMPPLESQALPVVGQPQLQGQLALPQLVSSQPQLVVSQPMGPQQTGPQQVHQPNQAQLTPALIKPTLSQIVLSHQSVSQQTLSVQTQPSSPVQQAQPQKTGSQEKRPQETQTQEAQTRDQAKETQPQETQTHQVHLQPLSLQQATQQQAQLQLAQQQVLQPKRQQLQLHLTQVPAPQLSLRVPQPKHPPLLVPQPRLTQVSQQSQAIQVQTQKPMQLSQQQLILKQRQLKQNLVPISSQQVFTHSRQQVLQQLKAPLTLQLQPQLQSQQSSTQQKFQQQSKTVFSLHRPHITQWKQHYKLVSDDPVVKERVLTPTYQDLQKKLEVKKSFNFAVPAKKPPPSTRHSGMVEWKNTFNMRPVMLTTLRERRSQRCGSTGSTLPPGRTPPAGYMPVGAARSLDLLRTNLQNAINRDIQQVLNKYMERFFNPAMDNIRTNLGQESVVEDHVRVLCLRVLEEAKMMYNSNKKKKKSDKPQPNHTSESHINEVSIKTENQDSPSKPTKVSKVCQTSSPGSMNPGITAQSLPGNLQQMYRKRKEMESEAEANRRKRARLMTIAPTNVNGVDNSAAKVTTDETVSECSGGPSNGCSAGNTNQSVSGTACGTTSGTASGTKSDVGPSNKSVNHTVNRVVNGSSSPPSVSTAPKVVSVNPVAVSTIPASTGSRVAVTMTSTSHSTSTTQTASQVSTNSHASKWDPERITADTLFVMGARANKVLGFGQTRGRIYSKHQELFKYPGDQEDKDWLTRNNFMIPTGGKAFVMIMQDIHDLAASTEYRNNPNVMLQELKGFRAPDFMLRKIRAFMQSQRTETLDDLSSLLDMELLPPICEKEGGKSTPESASPNSSRALLNTGVTDDSLIELALEYGVTLLGEGEATPAPPQLSAVITTLPPALEALTPRQGNTPKTKSVSVSTSTSSPSSPQLRPPVVKGLNRSLSLPSVATNTQSTNVNFNSEQLIEIPLNPTPTIEELELLIKTETTTPSGARALHRPHNAILDSIDPQEDVFDHIMRAEGKGEVGNLNADLDADLDASIDATLESSNLDENLDANLDASLDANLDLNLDVNLDMNLDSDGIGYLGLILEEDSSNQELNTPAQSPQTQEFPPVTQNETMSSSGENSLAMSHVTLSALLAGSTLDGLEIPEGLL